VSEDALRTIVSERRVIVCVGSGGVGKTTVAASLALKAAMAGRKVVVCTIDPARRLANSLGLTELGNQETRVPAEKFSAAGLSPQGTLFAMMLDMKRTWDDLVIRHVPAERRDAILESRFYQQLSSALAGSQEYIAMEKLFDLRKNRDYDLIVLDTPPTAHALDFLDAPNRVLDFFGNDAARWLLTPAVKAGKVGLRVFNLTGGYFVKTLSRFTGVEMLQELADFLVSLAPMYDVFKERAAAVKELLGSDETAFVLVSSPDPLTVEEAIYFHTLLRQNKMPVAAIVANRVNTCAAPSGEEGQRQIDGLAAHLAGATSGFPEPVEARLLKAIADTRLLAEVDAASLERIERGCAPTPLVRVRRFERDIHDLAGLWAFDRQLFGD
jgi:anion-transporting  ArsA/GET3 family ATPase